MSAPAASAADPSAAAPATMPMPLPYSRPGMVGKAWLNVNRAYDNTGGMSVADWKQRTEEGRNQMKERYKFIMQEVNVACGRFVDKALEEGVGLSLPTELGGHIPSFKTYDHVTREEQPCPLVQQDRYRAAVWLKRYYLHWVDVTTVAGKLVCKRMQPDHVLGAPKECVKVLPSSVEAEKSTNRNNCQLMILDGSFLGGKANIYMETKYANDQQNPTFNVYQSSVAAHQALLAAQLALMAVNAAPGGSVVLRMSMTWSHFTNGVLAMLRRVFRGEIVSYKPRSCHQTAISYYLVCKGFDPAMAEKLQWCSRFTELTQRLRSGAAAVEFVPFPEVSEGQGTASLYRQWGLALQVYHLPLWLFRKLAESAEQHPTVMGKAYKCRPCWRHLVFRNCPDDPCKQGAHAHEDLHPFIMVAFNQVTSHLYMPQLDGTLLPGQGHPRTEELDVANQVCKWYRAQLVRQMGLPPDTPLNPQVQAAMELDALPMVHHVWTHLLQICATQEQSLFAGTPAGSGVARYGPGGVTLRSPALNMQQFHNFSAARILKGPVPGGPWRESALTQPDEALIGCNLYRQTGAAAAGLRPGGVPPASSVVPASDIADVDMDDVGGDLRSRDQITPGDLEEDTLSDHQISGYGIPFLELQVEEGLSMQAMLDFYGG